MIRDRPRGGVKWRSIALSDEESGARRKPIIVLDDIPKSKDKARDASQPSEQLAGDGKVDQGEDRSPSAKQIESVVSEKHTVPTQSDVNASLESMRLEATRKSNVISSSKFETLLRGLAKGYTVNQLGRYLDRSIQPPSKKVYELQTTPWRPGRTPITQRLPREVKKKGPSTKMRIAEQILRLVWEITVESEENRDGELEIKLKPWQLSLLCDLTVNGTRQLESLVTPQTLVQNSEIQIVRPDNVMRITGRCQTAEEIARQLKLALLKVHRLEWDLKSCATSLKVSDGSFTRLFRDEDVKYVSQLTATVIVPENEGLLAIYCINRSGTLNARRLLLALLGQPRGSFNEVASLGDEPAGTTLTMPVGNSTVGVPKQYHGQELLRTVRPVPARKEGSALAVSFELPNVDTLASSLARQLDSVEPFDCTATTAQRSDSYWRETDNTNVWKANFCTLLHLTNRGQTPASGPERTKLPLVVHQHSIPGLENLFSYFEQSKDLAPSRSVKNLSHSKHNLEEQTLPYIKVHLRPSSQDLGLTTPLPRLEMRFRFIESRSGMGPRELTLTGMQAIVDEQHLCVSLPSYAADVVFTRKTRMLAKLDAVKADASIMAFVRLLQKSARSDKGALTAPAELSAKLPLNLVENTGTEKRASSPDVKVKYLFERFEQIQRLDFVPRSSEEPETEMDEDVKSTLDSLPRHLRLDYREVEGGAIYGNSTILSLALEQKRNGQRSSVAVEEQSEQTGSVSACSSSELAGSALRVAYLLTSANSAKSSRSSGHAKES